MPHELVAWGTHDKRYWSQYSADSRTRQCWTHAPVPVDDTGRRTIRIFGSRKTVLRDDNDSRCDPEACREYQQRQCNLRNDWMETVDRDKTARARWRSCPAARGGVCVRRRHLDAGDDDQVAVVGAVQRCGSKSSTRLAGWVGSRSRMSFRYALGSLVQRGMSLEPGATFH